MKIEFSLCGCVGFLLTFLGLMMLADGGVRVDEKLFGEKLGGWKKREKQAAEYPLSGTMYRTYKPEISQTPDGGIFVSVRIDHVRGWLSSDDHAILEITVDPKGVITSAQSNIAIQGRSISSDVISGTGRVGQRLLGPDIAVQIGVDLVADLSSKLLREKIVEAGRVSFPAVLRHNYNLLYQSILLTELPPEAICVEGTEGEAPPVAPSEPQGPKEEGKELKIEPYGTVKKLEESAPKAK